MKKEEMFEEIKCINEQLARIGADVWLPPDVDKIVVPIVKEGYKFLKDLSNLIIEWEAAYKLVTPEIWARYEAWGDFESHEEWMIRHKAEQQLRSATKKYKQPKLFKKTTWRKYNADK